ncbi:sugar transferase [Proteiniclasticum sp.]|uniref:sugar transferase n=1 Tax=Proteiniclasticum sp. TaxID=2053595 RepID=UPI00289B137E|nr:sugar transferase [Proteiniclasticum sp.]
MCNYNFVKRLLDVFFAVALLIGLAPILVIIAVLLKIFSEGPILFAQERLGKDSKPFKIIKFRTMKTDAPNKAARDIDNNEYVTKFGKLLRRTSLDELPQLLNILKGEMSFVGPRPFIPNEGEIIDLRKAFQIDKLKPGLTGWAQVIARDTCDQREKLKLDLYYKNNISILFDTKIILHTFFSLNGK